MTLGPVRLTHNLQTQQQYTDVKAESLSYTLHIHFHRRHEKYRGCTSVFTNKPNLLRGK
jgi:hypothetical protein